ncbi:hypothetical protein AKJ09_05857 [Labilithrix luteola]|uniref:Uncharacterized protein n=1 Tax=Labilithrix luteola TaxID=1391654 RepID=A0A0K1Q089_9BACT|nr:hypothetical protein AKJ09_05857 [Labilithrix luteola]
MAGRDFAAAPAFDDFDVQRAYYKNLPGALLYLAARARRHALGRGSS